MRLARAGEPHRVIARFTSPLALLTMVEGECFRQGRGTLRVTCITTGPRGTLAPIQPPSRLTWSRARAYLCLSLLQIHARISTATRTTSIGNGSTIAHSGC